MADSNARPIFVTLETTAFSGATLLAMLMNAHPDISSIGEIRGLIDSVDPATYLCSCGKNIKVCEFWEAVSEAMQRRGLAFDVSSFNTKYKYTHPYFLFQLRHGSSRNALIDAIRDQIVYALPMERSRLKAFANHIEAFAKSILEVDGNQVFVDSSKTKMILRALPQFGSMDVRAIHLVRRVEGVVASQLRRTGGDAEKEAHDWVKRHRRIDLWLKQMSKDKQLLVRYEDICNHTEETLQTIFEFCGVSTDLRKLNRDPAQQHIVGNSMRLRPLDEIKLDERWKNELDQMQIDSIRKIAGNLNQLYGYKVKE